MILELLGLKKPAFLTLCHPNDCTFRLVGSPGGYSHTLPIRVCAAQRGRDLEAPDLERGIHFRTGYKKLWITALSSA